MTPSSRRLLKRGAVLLALVVLAIGGVMGFRAVAGGDVGETCSMNFECKFGMRCARLSGLSRVCTRTCEADGECPTGWGCGEVLVVDRSDVMASIRQRVCLPGTPVGP